MSLRLVLAVVAVATSVAAPARAQVGSPNTITADPPVAHPRTQPCVVTLFDGVAFADFTPKPFAYAPACAGPWEKVVLRADFTVTAGRQFDRTANIWLGGVNVYFGTTAEPSRSVGRSWHVERDLTDYAALLTTAQPGEVDLGNLVDATYTGILFGSATLAFYPAGRHAPRTPDVVLPLSDRPTGGTVALLSPSSTLARTFTLPRNVERVWLDVLAQSQGGDEFWYLCVPDDVAGELQSCGGSGFRETEVTIDGQPAGVAPVYPWIFTGGIDPLLWQPIPGVETLAMTPQRVDLTPFAGLLSDGRSHTIALSVYNADNYFSATASLLLFLDRDAAEVRGAVTRDTLAPPSPTVKESLATAADGTISGTVDVASARGYAIEGWLDTSHGRVHTSVSGRVDFTNRQTFSVAASRYVQSLAQRTRVVAETRTRERGQVRTWRRAFEWPLAVDFTYVVAADGSATQTTTVDQRDDREVAASWDALPVAFDLSANRVHSADTLLFSASGAFAGNRDQASSQSYFAVDAAGRCYSRAIDAASGVVTAIRHGEGCP